MTLVYLAWRSLIRRKVLGGEDKARLRIVERSAMASCLRRQGWLRILVSLARMRSGKADSKELVVIGESCGTRRAMKPDRSLLQTRCCRAESCCLRCLILHALGCWVQCTARSSSGHSGTSPPLLFSTDCVCGHSGQEERQAGAGLLQVAQRSDQLSPLPDCCELSAWEARSPSQQKYESAGVRETLGVG